MKPRTSRSANLELLIELREALALIHDFCREHVAEQQQLMERLAGQILKIDRRYGDIEQWHRSGAGSVKADGS